MFSAALLMAISLAAGHPAPEDHTFHAVQWSFRSLPLIEVLRNFERITELPVVVEPAAQPLLGCVRLSIGSSELATLDEAQAQLEELLDEMGMTLRRTPERWVLGRKKGAEVPWGCKKPLRKPYFPHPATLAEVTTKDRSLARPQSQSRTYDVSLGARFIMAYVDGRPLGLKVFSIRKKSPLRAAGLENGDVILTVHGVPMDEMSRRALLFRAVSMGRGTVEIRRRGMPVRLELTPRSDDAAAPDAGVRN
ncbi:MAG: hypothetical protein AB2A00_32645 [Myxococcota bacterium]